MQKIAFFFALKFCLPGKKHKLFRFGSNRCDKNKNYSDSVRIGLDLQNMVRFPYGLVCSPVFYRFNSIICMQSE